MSSSLFHRLPPPVECLAILLGVAELSIFGLAGLANPTAFATGFGLPLPKSVLAPLPPPPSSSSTPYSLEQSQPQSTLSPGEEKTTSEDKLNRHAGLVEAVAARNVASGLCILAFGCYWRDRRALGTVVLINTVTTVADVLTVWRYGVKDAVGGHFIGVFNSTVIGSLLLLGWW